MAPSTRYDCTDMVRPVLKTRIYALATFANSSTAEHSAKTLSIAIG